jgi:hypothetical protein
MMNEQLEELIASVQNGQAIHFDTYSKQLVRDLNEFNKLTNVVHIITNGLRPNGPEYIHDLELTVFPPGTRLNEQFTLHVVRWCDTLWWVVTIPDHRIRIAEQIAKKYNFHLRNTVPVVIRDGGGRMNINMSLSKDKKAHVPPEALWFPIDTNTLTVEGLPKG